jgi:hypothetical protein
MSVLESDTAVWSRTQMNALRECRRKLLLSQRPEGDHVSPETLQQVADLKKIKNRFLWTGSVVHDTVGTVLKTLRQGAPLPGEDDRVNETRERMRHDFKNSKEASPAAERLFEHVYNVPVAPERWKDGWAGVESSLRWFLKSKWLERLKTLGPETWKAVDEVLSFDVGGVKAYVKIDLAVELNERFILIDWKSRAPKPEDMFGLQVAALYAHEVWGADPSQIDASAVSLLDGKRLAATVDEDALMETYMRIQEESGELQEALNAAPDNPFSVPPPADKKICARCNFQRVCFPAGLPA